MAYACSERCDDDESATPVGDTSTQLERREFSAERAQMARPASGARLTLATWLQPRPDRPATIPLPPDVTVRIGRVDGQAPADSAGVHTVGLNSREHSEHKDLLSRRHAEISWRWGSWPGGAVLFRDGNPARPAPSCNGSSINDALVPLGGSCEAPLGCTIDLGVPHMIPGRRPLPP